MKINYNLKRGLSLIINISLALILFITISTTINANNNKDKEWFFSEEKIDLNSSARQVESVNISELDGNLLVNPNLRYNATESRIPNWRIDVANNIMSGSVQNTTIESAVANGKRKVKGYTAFYTSANNTGHGFNAYVNHNSGVYYNDDSNKGFFAIGQTYRGLNTNKKYIFRGEFKSNLEVIMNIYPGGGMSGSGIIQTKKTMGTGKNEIMEIEFQPTQTEVTLSFRLFRDKSNSKTAFLNLQGVAFIEKESYIRQQLNKSITKHLKDSGIVIDQTMINIIATNVNKLKENSTNFFIDSVYAVALKDIYSHVLIREAKVENNSYSNSLPFNESDYKTILSNIGSTNYKQKLEEAKTLILNKQKNELKDDLIEYAKSLDPELVNDPNLLSILTSATNSLNKENYNTLLVDNKESIQTYFDLEQAKEELRNNILNNYKEEEYTIEDYNILNNKIDDLLETFKDINEVENYTFNNSDLETDLNDIYTKKDHLKDDILSNYNSNDYSTDNYDTIIDLVDEYLYNATTSDVDNFELLNSDLKAELDKVPTILVTNKELLKEELLKQYKEEDYSEINYEEVLNLIDTKLESITSVRQLDNLKNNLDIFKEDLNTIKTTLDEAKDNKILEILESYDESNYREENYQEIIETVTNEIYSLNDINEVVSFDLESSELKETLSKVKDFLDERKELLREEILIKYPEIQYSIENVQHIDEKINELLETFNSVDEIDVFDFEKSNLDEYIFGYYY